MFFRMDRRNLLTLVASLSALSAIPAKACNVAEKSPRSAGLENEQIRGAFAAWWERDADGFRSYFTDTLMADGTPMDPKLASELLAANPLPDDVFEIFDHFFLDRQKHNRIVLILNGDTGIVIGCSEQAFPATEIQPDCSGMPKQHLFFAKMSGLNLRSITHLATTATPEVGKFSIWAEGSS